MVDDEELLDLVEMKVRELLDEYKFPGDDTDYKHNFFLFSLMVYIDYLVLLLCLNQDLSNH